MNGVAQLAIGELHRRVGGVDVGAQVPGVLQRGVVGRLLDSQRRLGIVERLLRDQLRACAAPRRVRVPASPGRAPRRPSGRPACPRPAAGGRDRVAPYLVSALAERRLLLVEVVLELLAIELDERLAGLDAIAKVGEHAADDAVGLRGDGDLVFGRERPDDFDVRWTASWRTASVLTGRAAASRPRACAAPSDLPQAAVALATTTSIKQRDRIRSEPRV